MVDLIGMIGAAGVAILGVFVIVEAITLLCFYHFMFMALNHYLRS